jgi:hypothetical protein
MNRRTLCLLMFPLALALTGCGKKTSPGGHSTDELKRLTVDEVAARVAAHDGKTFVYDNNSKDRYTQSHVPTAAWVDFKNVTAADLPADKSATLIFYCASNF